MAARKPVVSQPHFPQGYVQPVPKKALLPWKHVRTTMQAAFNYWVCTVDKQNHPHATPVWGVWLDDCLYFDGSPETRRARNIAQNPAIVVHLEDGTRALILHGDAHEIKDAPLALRKRLSRAYSEKYAEKGYTPGPETWVQGGLYCLRPQVVLGWTDFMKDSTRWVFEPEDDE